MNSSLSPGLSIADASSILIALMALGFTVYQSSKQRKHERISVKPHLDFFESRSSLNDDISFTLTLHNNGLGPAIIKRHKVYKGLKGMADWEQVDVRSELLNVLSTEKIYTASFRSDFSIPANSKHTYLHISIKSKDQEAAEQLASIIYEYNVEIEYENMYGESFTLCTEENTKDKPFLRDRGLEELQS